MDRYDTERIQKIEKEIATIKYFLLELCAYGLNWKFQEKVQEILDKWGDEDLEG